MLVNNVQDIPQRCPNPHPGAAAPTIYEGIDLRIMVLGIELRIRRELLGSYATDPLEGHINRLKLIKRCKYGRAKFDLLRLRVLYHRQKNQGKKM